MDRTCADIHKARELLNYSPKVTFEEGIARTTEWYFSAVKEGLLAAECSQSSNSTDVSPGSSHLSHGDASDGDDAAIVSQAAATSSFVVPDRVEGVRGSRKRGMRRDTSELELSSYVKKASRQCTERRNRLS